MASSIFADSNNYLYECIEIMCHQKKDGFVDQMGVPVVLSYTNFLPINGQVGYILFTFTTGGKSYTVERTIILLVTG